MSAHSVTLRPRSPAAALWALCLALAGCQAEVTFPDSLTPESSPSRDADAATAPDPCEGKRKGDVCGDGRYCVHAPGGTELRCAANTCGDGVRSGDEECDDGNVLLGDRCSPACRRVSDSCGDGKVDSEEECDDGDRLADNACSNGCTKNICGNGRRDPGEECDDGNDDETDYCTNACTRSLCRDGNLDPGEECDDGNAIEDDGCTNACRRIWCGDGLVQEGAPLHEECDDANDVDDDGCSNRCTKNECGNKRVDPGEVCDSNACAVTIDGVEVEGACNATCDACEGDPCDDCLKERCGETYGLDLYTPCRVGGVRLATGVQPHPSFTQDCTALLQCMRFSGCHDQNVLRPFHSCACSDVPYPDDLQSCERLNGACLDALSVATAGINPTTGAVNPSCAEDDTVELGSCLEAKQQDLTSAAGYVFFMMGCMAQECPSECGLSGSVL